MWKKTNKRREKTFKEGTSFMDIVKEDIFVKDMK